MRVLVLTNHFAEFCGSAVVALEVASWFAGRGDAVTLAANYLADPIRGVAPPELSLTDEVEDLELAGFDLVWCQHDLLSLLPLAAFARASDRREVPLVAYVSLSPHEPYESVDPMVAASLGAEIFANSVETRRAIVERSHGLLESAAIRIFHNAAPASFWERRAAESRPLPAALRSLAMVSHHPPREISEAAERLQAAGIQVRRIGREHDHHLVTPEDLRRVDALVSIGKSAVYALATATPIYLYDHFGGDGWLSAGNFTVNAEHNFSGRPARRRLTAEAIVRELLDGFTAAREAFQALATSLDVAPFALDHHLAPLRERATARHADPLPSARLRAGLADARFRAHLEASRAKHHVMRHSYRALRGR